VFSPRKFFGVPDGGILRDSRAYLRHWPTLIPPPAEWWLACLEATTLRRDFDRHGGERRWYELFRQTQADAPAGPFAMSRLTQALLSGAVDAALTARRRRHNYRCLAEQLRELALFPELPAGVAPLGFPVCLAERDRVRQRLFARRIYPPVHWPLDGVVPTEFSDSHLLAREIMTLPCDQRYDPDDMDALAAAVKEAL